ncbi:MAG TPA: TIGR03619 family F420-dependent LLM class oxidoreductase [Pseudonocardiaceae bacterium]|nr:TIGR03619 family F420-dependent LLM class oxidoreductase [Pseudonocardiaceae bacterium]
MRFGVNILNFGPGTDPSTLFGWARFAEEQGYHFAMISDHVAMTPDVANVYPEPFYEPFATLAWLAGLTTRIELGTTVTIVPYRHPLLTARLVANIDQFTGGRFIFGVSAGWAEQEFDALGVPFEQRGAITDEYLEIIKRSWTEDVISADGEFVSFTGVATGPPPARRPNPPVWVGGSSRAAFRRAVDFGEAWHPLNARMEWLRDEGLPLLRRMAGKAGRPIPMFAPRTRLNLTDRPLAEDRRLPCEGTMDQIRGDLEGFAELGAEYVLFDTYPGTPARFREPEEEQSVLQVLADQALDLENQALR